MASINAHPIVEIELGSDSTQHDREALYGMPFGGAEARQLVAGYGSPTHLSENFYSLDFAMPEGTPVLAARPGVVVIVQDGFSEGDLREDLIGKANLVVVAHSDETLASYGHLKAGIEVSVGDSVTRGQVLGFSGSTGFSGLPHLHFHVGKRLSGGEGRTIPIQFEDPRGGVYELIEGASYLPGRSADAGDPPTD